MMPEIITCSEFAEPENIMHGFFLRKGGVSEGIYSSLNLGAGSKDSPEKIQKNRDIAIRQLSSNFDDVKILERDLYTLKQIHSNKVVTVFDKSKDKMEADAVVTDTTNIILGILTADCAPVLFADENAQIIGAAHAGWKGACSGILENTVCEMEKLGANINNITAVIGPTISQESYEVGAEFYNYFTRSGKNNAQFFIPSERKGHFMFNLPGFVELRLAAMELSNITNVRRNTYALENDFFSYRRSCHKGETDYGRNLSVIGLKAQPVQWGE